MATDTRPFDFVGDASSLGEQDSCALIEAARGGCDDALGELIRSLRGYLLLIANQELDMAIRAKVAPSDLVQSVLFRAQQNIGDFRGTSRQTLLAWLRKMLRNEIVTKTRHYRARIRDVQRERRCEGDRDMMTVPDTATSPQSKLVHNEEADQLRAAIEILPMDYRTVIYLRNWQQLPFEEIGRRMSRSEEAAKKLWQRAIRCLQKEWGDEP